MTLNLTTSRARRTHGLNTENIFPDGVKRRRKPRLIHDAEGPTRAIRKQRKPNRNQKVRYPLKIQAKLDKIQAQERATPLESKREKVKKKANKQDVPVTYIDPMDLPQLVANDNVPARAQLRSTREASEPNPEWKHAFDSVLTSMKRHKKKVKIDDVISEVARLRNMQLMNMQLQSLSLSEIHEKNMCRSGDAKRRMKNTREKIYEKVAHLRKQRSELVVNALNYVQTCRALPIDHIKAVPLRNIVALEQDFYNIPTTMQVALLSYVVNGTTSLLGVDGPVSVTVNLAKLSVIQFAFVELFVRSVLQGRIPCTETLDKQISDALSELADHTALIRSFRIF